MNSPRNEQELDINSIQALIQQGKLAEALDELDKLPFEQRNGNTALYLRGVCFRLRGDFAEAEMTLLKLIEQRSSYGRGFQELGHVYRDAGKLTEALSAYASACHMNPALKASWREQKALLDTNRHPERSLQVQERIDWVDSLPEILLACLDATHEGRLLKAEQLCRHFLQKNPTHIDGMRMLADIAIRLGVLEDAEFLLESAVAFQPQHKQARIDYIQALSKRQRYQKASNQAKQLLETNPENPQFQSLFAIQCMQLGNYAVALDMFDSILKKVPQDPVTHVSRGHALKTGGQTEAAIESYRRAIQNQPMHCEAWYSLANLKTYQFSSAELGTMEQLDKDPYLSGQDRVYLQFALGKAFEDSAQYDRSFRYYNKGNAIKRTQVQYQPEGTTRELEDQIAACTPDLFTADTGCQAVDPIFILGLPRAGSTLLEQILSSHSQVDGTLELPNILSLSGKLRRLGKKTGGRPYPYNLNDLSRDELQSLGQEYMDETRIHRQGAPFFIDKMPNNFRHIGLIKKILPNAKIIDARREPMACCFSGFKQLFAEGQYFSYSLNDLGLYYRDYVRLMAHWDTVMPNHILRVQHEDVVANLEDQVRRMLSFCGLPFETACVEYHKTQRNVRTPSSEQVRQPIFSTALAQWENYGPWLGPLKKSLASLAPHNESAQH